MFHGRLSTVTLTLAAVAALGCASRGERDLSGRPPVGEIITADEIQRTGASTAWEALKFTVRSHQFVEDRGQPVRIFSSRGVGSLVLREEPLLFVDGARLSDIQLLRQMPAHHILTIQVLSGSDGTTYFGTSAVAGVILIETTMGAD
ncbi:MAG: TonB-dependent receptor plug domain-containing protein, partial [Gemmatimonadota bacterium]